MARERYLLNEGEDTIHQNQIEPTTASEKRENWWFYHKTHVIVAVILAVFLGAVIYSFVSKEKPDYTIALMTEYSVPNDLLLDIEDHLEQYGEDLNGDGKVIVSLQHYRFSSSTKTDYEASELQAAYVRFASDAAAGDSMLYIYDDKSYVYLGQNDMEDYFAPADGTDNVYYYWKDLPGLNTLQLTHYTEEGATVENVLKVLGDLKVSVRSADGAAFEKEEKFEYRDQCIALLERLKEDQAVQAAAE